MASVSALFCSVAHAESTYVSIQPLFQQHCLLCHSGQHAAAGLSLDSYEGIKKGSLRGSVVKASDPEGSELIRRLKGNSQPRMPMTGPPFLTDAEINRVAAWIKAGLPKGQTAANGSQNVASSNKPDAGKPVNYTHVAPIFARRCVKCHTERGLMGSAPEGYLLNSYAATLSAGDRVRIIPGNSAASELYRRIKGYSMPRMPHDGPPYLSADEIALIAGWINDGARDSSGRKAPIPTGARVRFEGQLNALWNVDGATLIITGNTRIKKIPRPGDRVRVEGWVNAQGQVEVERIRRR
ncbi:MAG: c-type cytochrome [Gammaproteobacteria bacterium]|nr:c-type cytochrome [Gammaproteobacteria bacterium]